MEDVLEVYSRPYNPFKPVVCMDEKPFQLPGEVRESIPMQPGKVEKIDSDYRREGTRSIFIFTEPLADTWKRLNKEPGKTGRFWVLDAQYPDAEKAV
jgi:hypothetical protein